ncbi:MAG: cation diffusion facilitator family transporter [Actinomycetota bacterium]
MESHVHLSETTNIKSLRISAVLIGLYFIFEVTVAVITGSLSLLADAAHELSTAGAIFVSLLAIRFASRPPTPEHTYGYLRAEIIAALLNGLLLFGMAGFILYQGVTRLGNPMVIPSTPMFIVAVGGIWLEIASLFIMYRGQKENMNIRGSFWHVINAFLGSIAVIIAAIFIATARIYIADSIAGIIFAFVLVYGAFGLVRNSFLVLIEATPAGVDMSAIENDLRQIPAVTDIHHMHAWLIASGIKAFSVHVLVNDLSLYDNTLQSIKSILAEKYGFALSTVQIETADLMETEYARLEYRKTV